MDDLDLLLPEMPGEIQDLSVSRLRQQSNYQQRLPSIPGVSVDKFFMGDRAAEAAMYAAAMGIAYDEGRAMDVSMRAKARAQARLAQAYAEGRL